MIKVSKTLMLVGIVSYLVAGCSMDVSVSHDEESKVATKKPAGAEMTSGSSRQTTAGGYVVDSQIGHPFGQVVSRTSQNYTVYHSLKMSSVAE